MTGHRELDRPDDVERAAEQLVGDIVRVFERASEDPLGPCGSSQSGLDRFDRLSTECLALGTRIFGPLLDGLTHLVTSPLRRLVGAPRWPRVPVSPRRPSAEHRTPLKLTVISSLAAGADQVVARAVCRLVRHPEKRNRYLEAVLPFPAAAYEEDFTDAGDLAAFRAFLKLDCGRFNTHPEPTVLYPAFPGCVDPDDPSCPLPREKAYAAAGRYIVEASEILIAVWDPARTARPGGTADTVRHALNQGRVVLWLNPAELSAGSCVLRAGKPDVHDRPVVGRGLPGGMWAGDVPSRAKDLSRNFHRLAAYNRDGTVDSRGLERDLRTEADRLTRAAEAAELPASVQSVLVGGLLPHVMRADHLSQRYRRLRDFSARLWPTTAAVVVSLMAFQIVFLPALHWLAYIELGVMLLGYFSYRVSLHGAWHEKWLNDRRLAEGLRSALFVTLVRSDRDREASETRLVSSAGLATRIQDPLPFYNPTNAWFVATMKRVLAKERARFAETVSLQDAAVRRAVARFLRSAWLLDQKHHHEMRAVKHSRIVTRTRWLRPGMIGLIACVAVLHALGIGGEADESVSVFAHAERWLAFLTVALPAWAAAFHVMSSLDDHERMAERCERMAVLLAGLVDEITRVETAAQLRGCVEEAERVMDLENAEWAESLIDRHPEFTG